MDASARPPQTRTSHTAPLDPRRSLMPDEPNVAPVEPDQPQVEPSAPAAPPETGQGAEPQPSPFDEKFDPASLPDELRPAYNQMRADYTQKTQSLADQRREAEQYQQIVGALTSDDPEMRTAALTALGYDYSQPEIGRAHV